MEHLLRVLQLSLGYRGLGRHWICPTVRERAQDHRFPPYRNNHCAAGEIRIPQETIINYRCHALLSQAASENVEFFRHSRSLSVLETKTIACVFFRVSLAVRRCSVGERLGTQFCN